MSWEEARFLPDLTADRDVFFALRAGLLFSLPLFPPLDADIPIPRPSHAKVESPFASAHARGARQVFLCRRAPLSQDCNMTLIHARESHRQPSLAFLAPSSLQPHYLIQSQHQPSVLSYSPQCKHDSGHERGAVVRIMAYGKGLSLIPEDYLLVRNQSR